jgi:alkylation response protein AidB-like acyl-CoA dehydrogenase
MDFGLNSEQLLLGESARDFLTRESPTAIVRKIAEDPTGFSPELERKIAAQGWSGVLIPAEYDGLGLEVLDAAVLLIELGRALTPSRFLSSSLVATSVLLGAGSKSQKKLWLPRLASGEATATLAWLEENDRLDPPGIALKARRNRDAFRLRGTKLFVLDAQSADLFIVAARTGPTVGTKGITLMLVPRDTEGLSFAQLDSFDRTRRMFELKFDDVVVPRAQVLGSVDAGWRHLTRALDLAAVGVAAESQGGAERALGMAVDYSKVREQFGRPIGSFQSLKHIAAECFAEIEPARSLVWYAAWAHDHAPRESSRAASMVKARLGDVYSKTTNCAVQMHGGIGFTWEHDIHFWFKRAKANEALYGTPAFHRERVAELSGW